MFMPFPAFVSSCVCVSFKKDRIACDLDKIGERNATPFPRSRATYFRLVFVRDLPTNWKPCTSYKDPIGLSTDHQYDGYWPYA